MNIRYSKAGFRIRRGNYHSATGLEQKHYRIFNRPCKKIKINRYSAPRTSSMSRSNPLWHFGSFLKIHPIVSLESVMKALRKTLPERHHHLLPMNEQAILKGMEIIEKD